MAKRYRTWEERRQIIKSIIADNNPPGLETFHLTDSELVYFRARSNKVVDRLARQSSTFKSYYKLPTAKPFWYVIYMSALVAAGAISAGAYLTLHNTGGAPAYSLLAACATITVVAIGWAVVGWTTHRNTVRQNTNNMLFARFSQAPFGEALFRFHREFGWSLHDRITTTRISALRNSGNEDKIKAASAVTYILNYFELIAAGVIHGDLDQVIVRNNVKNMICSYHDICWPYIMDQNKANPRVYEYIIKLRTHYREP